jgi:hypothetical protein
MLLSFSFSRILRLGLSRLGIAWMLQSFLRLHEESGARFLTARSMIAR